VERQEDVVKAFIKMRNSMREDALDGCTYLSNTVRTKQGNIVSILFAEKDWTLYFISAQFGKEAKFIFSPRDNSIKNFVRECYLEIRQNNGKKEFVQN